MAMREVRQLFDDYTENITAIKRYEQIHIKEEIVKVKVSKFEREKVQGGAIVKEDTKLARRIDATNSNSNAIKRIKKDLKPFLEAWAKVTKEQRALLRSRYIRRKAINEVAEEFGLTLSVTKDRLSKAEKRFYRLYMNCLEVK
jgi:DNA-directed RNA polymerase specialized sigma24 family protein